MMRTLKIGSLLLTLCATAAHAQLYKSVGPDGKVTYSDTLPASAGKVETKTLAIGDISASYFPFELKEAVKSHPVTLYTTRDCAPCDDGRRLLTERGVPFTEKTVNNNEDIAQFRKAGGDSNLPLLIVGRDKERGYDAGVWNNALTSAGYPTSNKLPKTYRNPSAEAAAPTPKPVASAKQDTSSQQAPAKPASTELPPAIGNAPPGFRF